MKNFIDEFFSNDMQMLLEIYIDPYLLKVALNISIFFLDFKKKIGFLE